jgi:hypothetical protein
MVTPNSSSLQLVIQRGPTPGYAYPLAGSMVTIGRAGDNAIVIADAQVSRHHARLTWQSGGWAVEDLGSANGVFVNEVRITSLTWLRPGDTLRLGDTVVFAAQSVPSAEATLVAHRPPAPQPPGAGPTPTRRRRRWPLVILALGGLLACLAVIAVAALFLLRPRQMLTPPSVVLQQPPHGSYVALGEPTVIIGTARDLSRIVRVELWADGQLVAVRRSDRSEGFNPFPFFYDWTPSDLGQHVLFARAYTADGRLGQSNVLTLLAEEGDETPAVVEYPVVADETLADVAGNVGSEVDTIAGLNPDLPPGGDPAPGDTLLVPDPDEGPSGTSPEDEPEEPAEAPPEDLGPVGGMSAPAGLMGADQGCAVRLTWADAGDESGYRIYGRVPAGAVFTLLDSMGADTTEHLFPVDLPGSWSFYVVAFDGGGAELASPPVEVLVAPGPACPSPVAATLAFDALRLSAPPEYGQVYCYASLANAPFERVPLTDSEFVVRAGDGLLHIEDYMAGPEARQLGWPEGMPLPVEFDCWGWAGLDLNWLGHFRNEHPTEEWDGRELTGSDEDFTLVYTINHVPAPGEAPHTDPGLEPPYHVRLNGTWGECLGTVFRGKAAPTLGDLLACLSNPSIAWDWPYDESHVHGFRVIMRQWAPGFPGSATETVLAEISEPASRGTFIPPLPGGCGQAVEYRVVAFVYGRQSPPSPDSTGVENAPCPAGVAVTWETFTPHNLTDGGGTIVEGYGWIDVNGNVRAWNHPLGPYTPVSSEITYNWADQRLDGTLHSNVMMYYPIGEGEDLTLGMSLYDYDFWSSDDRWCRGFVTLPARSAAEWATVDETAVIEGTGLFGQSCTLVARVGGVMLPPPAVAAQSNLEPLTLERASDGSLNLTLRSHGPDFLLDQQVRLISGYERSRTDGGGSVVELVTFPAEEVTVTLPVNTAISLPLPFSAEEGWTTTVWVRVEPVTFLDPDPVNNELETTFYLE